MDGLKVKSLVIKEISVGESDKLLTLLCDSNEKITAKIRGVRKSKSMLGHLAHPFSYCDFILSERSGHYVITNGEIIDSFYGIREDTDKYYIASVILESLDLCSYGHERDLLNLAVMYLKELSIIKKNYLTVLNKYLLSLIDALGYGIDFVHCVICGCTLENGYKLCLETGGIACLDCKTTGLNVEVKSKYFNDLKKTQETDIDKLDTFDMEKDDLIEEMNLLIKYLYYQSEVKLQSVLSLRSYFDI